MVMTLNGDGTFLSSQSIAETREALLAAEAAGDLALAGVLREKLSELADGGSAEAEGRATRVKKPRSAPKSSDRERTT